jgi:hypothetical protein
VPLAHTQLGAAFRAHLLAKGTATTHVQNQAG